MMTPEHARWVLKLVALAVTAAVALIGAVLMAVPSGDGVRLCLNVAQCLHF
jgi:preprotein translocase subunit SecG